MLFSSVDTVDEAKGIIKQGAIAGYISAAITIGMVAYVLTQGSSSIIADYVSVASLFDALIVALLAFGVQQNSRIASSLLVAVFLVAKIDLLLLSGVRPSFGAIIFLYFFGRAAYGTFVYHRLVPAEEKFARGSKRIWQWGGGILGTILLLLAGFGLLTSTALIPSTKVLAGNSIPQGEVEALVSAGIVRPNEEIVYFYSDDLFSVSRSGSVLTRTHVVAYWTNDESELERAELPLEEISDVEKVLEGSYFEDSVYQVYGKTRNEWMQLWLSTEGGGDERFISAIKERVD